jgi:hypothetical protein
MASYFKVVGQAELKSINLRAEIHGEELVRAVDLKLAITECSAKELASLMPGFLKAFWNGDNPALQEVYPIKIRHSLENTDCTISVGKAKVFLPQADLKKINITPKFGGVCDVVMSVQASHIPDGILDPLHKWLRGEVHVEAIEKQSDVTMMAQA